MVRVRPKPPNDSRPGGRPSGVTGSDVTVSPNDSNGFRRPSGIASVRTRPSPQVALQLCSLWFEYDLCLNRELSSNLNKTQRGKPGVYLRTAPCNHT